MLCYHYFSIVKLGVSMKLKSLLFVCSLGVMSSLFAANRHVHPESDANKTQAAVADKAMMPGFCEIEIINRSFDNVTVFGTYEDSSQIVPFDIYSNENPHYVSLYYRDFDGIYRCHNTMYVAIETFNHYPVYSAYTRVGSTINVVPYLNKQIRAEVKTK